MDNMKQDEEQAYSSEPNPNGFFSDLTNQNACSVRVAVRVRPLYGAREQGNQRTCVTTDESDNKLQIADKNFQFDQVFDQSSTQIEMFNVCAKNLVLGCLAGFNATIIAYGQTGSGKTHSMGTGSTVGMSEDQIGIVPRVFAFIFDELHQRQKQSSFSEFTIKCSFLELYNEELHDLLDPNGMMLDKVTLKPMKELQIREEKNGSIRIDNLKEEPVTSKEECLNLLNKGISHRVTSATLCNEQSSRSHAIFTVSIEQKIVKEAEQVAVDGDEAAEIAASEEHISAKFHFVDLAGSERIKKTGATGQLLKEGISINKGLLSLGNVISALTEESRKNAHIPYRDSKLTRILQDSLGGNSRTTMIACVSPAEINHEETLNSIKYASRARNIKNKPVVNRDANSILIESLKTQISQLTGEISEYQKVLKDNNISLPEGFSDAPKQSNGPPLQSQQTSHAGGGSNPGELREIKIKLSKKEKEYKELQEQLEAAILRQKSKDLEFNQIQKERDILRMKNEILVEHMQKNNIQLESEEIGDTQGSLIDEYKAKIEQMQAEMEKKNQEIQAKGRKIAEMQMQSQRDEELLRKHLEENQKLKRQVKKNDEMGPQSANGGSKQSSMSYQRQTKNSNKEENGGVTDKLSQLKGQMREDFNEKFINNLASQIGNMLVTNSQSEDTSLNLTTNQTSDSIEASDLGGGVGGASTLDDTNNSTSLSTTINIDESVEEKERILEAVKSSTEHMKSKLEKLMNLECDKKIQEIEKDLLKADNDRKDNIKKASNDSSKVQQIEKDYKQKMDELSKKLGDYKEKEKKQEQVIKQLSNQESKLKTLESDIQRIKKSKDDVEKQMKLESEKFSKFKSTVNKELVMAKKYAQDKEKMMLKLKQDLKKTDQIAQQKVAELKGLQKRAKDEKLKREQQKIQEQENKGIDIDRIKDWIIENTSRMLNHRDLKEQLERLIDDREHIEEDMLTEGDKLTELMLQKERKEAEQEMLETEYHKQKDEGVESPDEGPILEIEQELDGICTQITMITDALDSMDQTLDFLSKNINEISEDLACMDADNVEPLQFSGLQSVDAAKVTLQTFFTVLLDLNIYKRDLETKCIEQDEAVLEQNEKIAMLQMRVDELVTKLSETGHDNLLSPQTAEGQSKVLQMQKDKAIKNIVESLEGYVEHDNIKHLNLTPNEQTSLTKLSLSKIVSNLKTKLREEEARNSNLSHKLEHAINEKEALKQKFDQFKKEQRSNLMVPMSQGKNGRNLPTPSPSEQPNSAGGSSVGGAGGSQVQPKTLAKPTFRFKAKQQASAGQGEEGQIKILNQSKVGTQSQLSQRRAEKQQQKDQLPVSRPQSSLQQTAESNGLSPAKRQGVTRQIVPPQKDLLEITTYTRPKGPLKTIVEKSQQQQQKTDNAIATPKMNSLKDKRAMKKLGGNVGATGDQNEGGDNNKNHRSGSNQNLLEMSMISTGGNEAPTKMPSLKDRRNQRKQGGGDNTGRMRSTSNAHFSSTLGSLGLDQQVQQQQPKQIASLKDKRNQKKADDSNTGTTKHKKARSPSTGKQAMFEDLASKLDAIQESVHQKDNTGRGERRQSRARAYSKIHERTFQQLGKTLDQSRLDESSYYADQYDTVPVTPSNNATTPSKKNQREDYMTVPSSDQKNYNDDFISPSNLNQQIPPQIFVSEQEDYTLQSPSKEIQNRWSKEDLVTIGYNPETDVLIDFECVNGKIIMVFEDFTIKEYSMEQKQLTNELNLRDLIGSEFDEDKVVAFAIDKELGLIAVACLSQVMLFDFQDNFSPVSKIDIPNICQVCFCQFFIIVMIIEDNETIFVCYQIDDELVEMGSYIIENNDQRVILKSDNQFAYIAQDSVLQKLAVPNLEQVFVANTGHSGPIINFTITPKSIFTTSLDSSLRGFSLENGAFLTEPVDDLECDHLETEGDFVLTRCGGGQAFLVWKQTAKQKDLQLIDEIDLDQLESEVIDFKMKGKITASIGGTDYNYIIMMSITQEEYVFKALRHKPLSS